MNSEILRLVDTIHRDKEIDKDVIFKGIEAALLSAARKKLGESEDARVAIDRETGEIKVFENDEEIVVGDLGRLAASQGKQVLFQKIREAERDRIFEEYESKLGQLVSGIVQRVEGPNLIVNLGRVEGILPRSEQAPGERFRVGERIKVLIKDLRKNTNRVKITLSRASEDLVRALFELEVPEIAEKVIEIMEIAREPGYRTKIAVTTYDHNVDCVGACVGVRGSRIKNIVDELFGEKIDIVRWNESIEVLIMNSLKPAEICSMDLDFETRRAIVYVKPEQQSLAIGKRGQNVRLASKLTKWELDIVTVSDEELEKLRREEVPQDGAPLSAEQTLGGDHVPPAESAVEQPAGVSPADETEEEPEAAISAEEAETERLEASVAPATEATGTDTTDTDTDTDDDETKVIPQAEPPAPSEDATRNETAANGGSDAEVPAREESVAEDPAVRQETRDSEEIEERRETAPSTASSSGETPPDPVYAEEGEEVSPERGTSHRPEGSG